MIELRDVRHRYPESDWELTIPELALPPGEVTGIIGPNGSGKTTLLRIAAGLMRPLQGHVRLGSKPLAAMKRRHIARTLGYLPQEPSSEYDLTVEDLAAMGRYPHLSGWGRLTPSDRDAIDNSLDQAGMNPLRRRNLSQLSGGEKQRAFLASVLAQQPRCLLLDEPTAALDLPHQIRLFRVLRGLVSEGMSVVVVTHDVNLASMYSDRLLMMSRGRSLAVGPPHQVLTEEYVRQVYGPDVILSRHPENGRPLLIARSLREVPR